MYDLAATFKENWGNLSQSLLHCHTGNNYSVTECMCTIKSVLIKTKLSVKLMQFQ